MTDTKIEWTNKTWNPVRARNLETNGIGHFCEKISPGCANCYANRMQPRFRNKIRYNAADRDKVALFLDERVLIEPLHWRAPKMIFPCSMTDLFADFVPDEWIDRIFAVMSLAPQHTFQILTKRPERMRDYLAEARLFPEEFKQTLCDGTPMFIKTSEKTAPFMAGMNPQPPRKRFQVFASTCRSVQGK
jgi:protein gp37